MAIHVFINRRGTSAGRTSTRSSAPAAWCSCGDGAARRIVGFFAGNTVVAIADDVAQPIGSRVIGSPPPELVGAV